MTTPEPTYYELLGITPDATPTEIKSAFRQQVKRNHPDQGGNAALFRLVESAYEVLINPTSRANYDSRLAGGEMTPPEGVRIPNDEWGSWQEGEATGAWDTSDWKHAAAGGWAGEPAASGANREPPVFVQEPPSDEEHSQWTIFARITTWVIIGLLIFALVLPGLDNGGVTALLIGIGLFWLFGSFVLRWGAWAIVITSLMTAHWSDTPVEDTVSRLALAFGMWIAGQWFFTFRKGRWRSLVAFSLLNKLPWQLRPDRRWVARQNI